MKTIEYSCSSGLWRGLSRCGISACCLLLCGCSERTDRAAAKRPADDGVAATSISTPATRPAERPGLHNVLEVGPGFWSGSSPEGEEGFQSLARLGVKTILSVDGARPETEAARAHGMRYVHIPVGYDGIPSDKQRHLARAIRDLPGPVYVHCHHGKHRGPAAAVSAAILLGVMPEGDGIAFLKRAGTADMYTGLYGCVRELRAAEPAALNAVPADFPEVARVSGFVEAMVRVDEHFEHLQLIQKAGWKTPPDHPDLVPAQEARMLAELLAGHEEEASSHAEAEKFAGLMRGSSRTSAELAANLNTPQPEKARLDQYLESLRVSCRDCHRQFRDQKP